METDRYHRQILLPQIGQAGQARLAASRVLLVGCGALGGVIAELLVRAGVGFLCLVDRDLVEWSNLQRQVLYEEEDARQSLPKAVAAANRLRRVNSSVQIDAQVLDMHAGNIEELFLRHRFDLVLDGTDNVETRYLINDWCIKHRVPWVYGACVGTEGRVMPILPAQGGPCLRCVFPQPPQPGELATCDTAGVLGPAVGVVASIQSALAIRILSGDARSLRPQLLVMDVWTGRYRAVLLGEQARREDCVCCGQHRFEFLQATGDATASLCGRKAIQVRPPGAGVRIDLPALAQRLSSLGDVQTSAYLVRCTLREPARFELTIFPDGRVIVSGTDDPAQARSLVSRYVGM